MQTRDIGVAAFSAAWAGIGLASLSAIVGAAVVIKKQREKFKLANNDTLSQGNVLSYIKNNAEKFFGELASFRPTFSSKNYNLNKLAPISASADKPQTQSINTNNSTVKPVRPVRPNPSR